MDLETTIVIKFLRAIADIRMELQQFREELSRQPSTIKTTLIEMGPRNTTRWHWDEEQQRHSVTVEYCVSATFTDDSMVDWTLSISGDAMGWYGEHRVDRSLLQEEYSDRVTSVEWDVDSLDDLITYLPQITKDLRAGVDLPELRVSTAEISASE